jgi:hypothetical protein
VCLQSVAWVDEEGEEEDAPFAGGSPRGQRGGGKRRRIDEDDAVDALQRLRGDLEVSGRGVWCMGVQEGGGQGCCR